MRLAIIPARGGSKRIPRKNIRHFRGKPMIAWSIDAAIQSGCFDKIIVSTDCEEIAQVARECGAKTPFTRPAELADDFTPTFPVLQHAVEAMELISGEKITLGCCIYATAPFTTADMIQAGQDRLTQSDDLDFALSVTSFPFPIQRALCISDMNRVQMLHPEHENTRSQDLTECYHDAGQFYWFRRDSLFDQSGFFSGKSAPVIIPRERVQDIDTEEDWHCAELAHELLEKRST
jgi:N-acylneuraminate cytidylyltransferase